MLVFFLFQSDARSKAQSMCRGLLLTVFCLAY